MNKFIKKISCFIIPILIVLLYMEYVLRVIPNDYKLKNDYLEKNAKTINTLILGNSHAFYGINPAYFNEITFNVANISQAIDYDYEIFLKYKKRMLNLKTIIINISYSSLYFHMDESIESWREKNYLIYFNIKKTNRISNYSEILTNQFSLNSKKIVSYYLLNKNQLTSSEYGWGNNYLSVNGKNLIDTGESAAKRHTKKNIYSEMNRKIYFNNLNYLNTIVDYCGKYNIKVLFIIPPAYVSYKENLDSSQLNNTVETIQEICENNIFSDYINFLNDNDFIEKDFYDGDHLNEFGAEKLSKKINNKIINWH